MSEFTYNLKKLRKEHKMTQKELGKILHVSQNAIYNWENGKCEPSISTINKIADYFNVSVSDLLNIEDTEKYKPQTIAAHLDTNDLTEKELEDVARYIEFIKSKKRV